MTKVFAALVLFSSVMVAAAAEEALAVKSAPTDAKIHFAGRFDTRDAKGPRMAWPGCSATLHFNGTAARVSIKDNGKNRYEIFVDGKRVQTIKPDAGETTVTLAENLPKGEHAIQLVRCNESFNGVSQILGWETDGPLVQAPAPKRSIELIGDSITCGYGNEAPAKEDRFSNDNSNASLAYGFVAAHELGADYSAVAWSGKKLWPNNSIVDLYPFALPDEKNSTWNFAAHRAPDAVLVNLGTNDFNGATPEEEGWVKAYIEFIAQIRTNYPKARIYLAIGPMMHGEKLNICRGYIQRAITESGDKNIAFIAFPVQDGKLGYGADWHPSAKTHAKMADVFVAALKKDLGW